MTGFDRRVSVWTGLGLLLLGSAAASAQAVKRGDVFPPFSGSDVRTGKTISLEKLRGKVVLVDFWATWCGPCRGEVPNVVKTYEKFHKQGFEVISISLDRNVEALKPFISEQKMDWNHIFDKEGKLRDKYGLRGIPQMYVIGRDGKVLSESARGGELERVVEAGLKENAPDPKVDEEEQGRAELAKADQLRAVEKYEEALKHYDEVASKYADSTAGKTAVARARELRENPEIVRKMEERKAANLEKDAVRGGTPWLTAARQMTKERKFDLARKYYQRVIDKYPSTALAKTAEDEMKKLPSQGG
jgi:peroxiredoxin